MGTYTANYQLYMPTVGEQGWGDLMNGNLTTIDTTMAGLNTRVSTLEGGKFNAVELNNLVLKNCVGTEESWLEFQVGTVTAVSASPNTSIASSATKVLNTANWSIASTVSKGKITLSSISSYSATIKANMNNNTSSAGSNYTVSMRLDIKNSSGTVVATNTSSHKLNTATASVSVTFNNFASNTKYYAELYIWQSSSNTSADWRLRSCDIENIILNTYF